MLVVSSMCAAVELYTIKAPCLLLVTVVDGGIHVAKASCVIVNVYFSLGVLQGGSVNTCDDDDCHTAHCKYSSKDYQSIPHTHSWNDKY